MALEDIYTREWFAHDFPPLREEFALAGRALWREFQPDSVIDLGCGPGMMLDAFVGRCDVRGIEGSSFALEFASPFVRSRIAIVDLVGPEFGSYGFWDLTICTEVAEHIDEDRADVLVDRICDMGGAIVFTAAPPGQGGHHHVNCQPKDYWIEKFGSRGALYDEERTKRVRDRWWGLKRLGHMRNNVMVFE